VFNVSSTTYSLLGGAALKTKSKSVAFFKLQMHSSNFMQRFGRL